jgi:putative hemolysin
VRRDPFQREVDLMQAIDWDVFLIPGLILASGLLAMAEFAIGSARKSRLRQFAGVLSTAADRVLRALRMRAGHEPPVTQEEISDLLREGTKAGVFEEGEHELIKRVFRFSDRRARALMTPRNKIIWIDLADSPEEIRRKVVASPHNRFPVCDQSLDNLLGIVQVKDFLVQDPNSEPFRIKGRLTLPLFIYEGTRGLKILEMFKTSGSRIAVVLDEYGTVEGLLSLTDILEAIVGDMPLGDEDDEPSAVQRSDGSWLLDGRMPLDEFRDLFDLASIPEGDFHTLAGLVVTQLGHIPRVAESFDRWGMRFEVVDMDGNRVDRILVNQSKAGQTGS